MSTDVATIPHLAVTITPEQTDLIKRTICAGASDAEMQLFFFDCQRRGVHPLDKLIHFTKRSGKYTPITSIDFFRQRAHSSGAYAGEEPPAFELLTSGAPDVCTYTVYRIVQGVRCPWTAKARWDEYYPGDSLGFMWKKMPFLMLAKCAEALALRKAFPAELQGLYVKEEMEQAGPVKVGTVPEEHAAADGLGSVRQASEPMRTATAEAPPVSQDAQPPSDDLFVQSSALADHEVALTECHTMEELQKVWDDIVRDPRLSSETRPKLYQQFQRIVKSLKAKK